MSGRWQERGRWEDSNADTVDWPQPSRSPGPSQRYDTSDGRSSTSMSREGATGGPRDGLPPPNLRSVAYKHTAKTYTPARANRLPDMTGASHRRASAPEEQDLPHDTPASNCTYPQDGLSSSEEYQHQQEGWDSRSDAAMNYGTEGNNEQPYSGQNYYTDYDYNHSASYEDLQGHPGYDGYNSGGYMDDSEAAHDQHYPGDHYGDLEGDDSPSFAPAPPVNPFESDEEGGSPGPYRHTAGDQDDEQQRRLLVAQLLDAKKEREELERQVVTRLQTWPKGQHGIDWAFCGRPSPIAAPDPSQVPPQPFANMEAATHPHAQQHDNHAADGGQRDGQGDQQPSPLPHHHELDYHTAGHPHPSEVPAAFVEEGSQLVGSFNASFTHGDMNGVNGPMGSGAADHPGFTPEDKRLVYGLDTHHPDYSLVGHSEGEKRAREAQERARMRQTDGDVPWLFADFGGTLVLDDEARACGAEGEFADIFDIVDEEYWTERYNADPEYWNSRGMFIDDKDTWINPMADHRGVQGVCDGRPKLEEANIGVPDETHAATAANLILGDWLQSAKQDAMMQKKEEPRRRVVNKEDLDEGVKTLVTEQFGRFVEALEKGDKWVGWEEGGEYAHLAAQYPNDLTGRLKLMYENIEQLAFGNRLVDIVPSEAWGKWHDWRRQHNVVKRHNKAAPGSAPNEYPSLGLGAAPSKPKP
ncbi:unnamed protein product [Vitrella brassicaformis CCMP3155]|uniref:Uncharacterized protein n=3 Tax=Vitrella brassicaformis TaxID=1169539 RepID=A0A0G4H7C6_VITBC|nr:unnamed protein product [Vitrella brassicaformis CCMP3155]|mmetsp:Transcript_45572/g.128655  ORF Transcript_45572/g.128655 Transcript_45572/m.128655 type:complete len:696 (+) Transcript_45572:150-2237(+)|eukprot:CEM39550.1 unnamed protein product [Vitrella brassicaformis CCMP3155]